MLNTKDKISFRIPVLVLADILLISVSFLITHTFVIHYADHTMDTFSDVLKSLIIYDAITVLSLICFGSYRKKILSKAPETVISVALSVLVSHIVCETVFSMLGTRFYFGMVAAGAISAVFVIVCHILQNLLRNFYLKSFLSNEDDGIPTLIIGAGFTGKMVYHELTANRDSGLKPVCFIDDDKEKISTEICGLNVYGPAMLIPELCKKHKIGMIIFAIPSCPVDERDRILSICSNLNCDIRVIPSLSELKSQQPLLTQAHAIDFEKLLGRDAINIENNKVQEFLSGKVCLVTGGGGSIGSELCRQIVRMKPKKVVIVDIYENNAYEIQQELAREGYGSDLVSVEIGSVRDMAKMRVIFEEYKFDVIFHAAAHKHVPLMETNPEEAIKNNVKGTYNIAHLAHRYNVQKMVLISTDKAVNPTNVMGASKRVCEMVMQYMSQTYTHTKFTSVRFGNVLGSNGSVIPLFTRQIEAGGPVTVTHPDVIRYFMTIPEAVSLVLEAGTMSKGGETFVLDMGKPVKIVTLAENLIKMYGYKPYEDMQIEFCGLRQGEKLYEELLLKAESLKATHNKKIFIMDQPQIDCEAFKANMQRIMEIAGKNSSDGVVDYLRRMVPEFKTPEEVNNEIEQSEENSQEKEAVTV